jgi:hypothetical protein
MRFGFQIPLAGISLRTPSCKTPTNLTADGCPAQAQVLNDLTAVTPPVLTLVRSFTAKGMYFNEPVQGLNLNRWPIARLEPVIPVTESPGRGISPSHRALPANIQQSPETD